MIPPVPTVFGHEFAGIVAAVGAGVARLREGDRLVAANSAPVRALPLCRAGRPNLCEDLLFVNGAYGEFIALPPRLVEKNLVPIGPAAARAPRRLRGAARLRAAGHRARARGAGHDRRRSSATGPSAACSPWWPPSARRACSWWARAAGASTACARPASPSAWTPAPPAMSRRTVRELTGGRGAEVTVDATGRPEVWEQALDAVGRGGTVVFFGGCAPGTQVRVDTRRAHYEELTLVGAFHHRPELIRRAVDLLESEALVPDPLMTHAMALDEVPRALALMAAGQALKVADQSGDLGRERASGILAGVRTTDPGDTHGDHTAAPGDRAGRAPRLLRGGRSRHRHRGAGPPGLPAARLRAQGDRAQPARGRGAAGQGRPLRGRAGRGARRRHRDLQRPRHLAGGAPGGGAARACA